VSKATVEGLIRIELCFGSGEIRPESGGVTICSSTAERADRFSVHQKEKTEQTKIMERMENSIKTDIRSAISACPAFSPSPQRVFLYEGDVSLF
jgi:hypothetical protein